MMFLMGLDRFVGTALIFSSYVFDIDFVLEVFHLFQKYDLSVFQVLNDLVFPFSMVMVFGVSLLYLGSELFIFLDLVQIPFLDLL